jgi:hypothetical protein
MDGQIGQTKFIVPRWIVPRYILGNWVISHMLPSSLIIIVMVVVQPWIRCEYMITKLHCRQSMRCTDWNSPDSLVRQAVRRWDKLAVVLPKQQIKIRGNPRYPMLASKGIWWCGAPAVGISTDPNSIMPCELTRCIWEKSGLNLGACEP